MQFTPQQLAGAGRYSHKTRIGNWCEDMSIEEVKLNDFMHKKKKGTLLTVSAGLQEDVTLQSVPLSYSADGCVRFGDSVQLQSLATNGKLGCNTFEKLALDAESFSVSCALPGSKTDQARPAAARTAFVIEKYADFDYPDDILRTGQPFLLGCNPSLRIDSASGMLENLAYLSSRIIDTNRFAKMSNHQEVSVQSGNVKYAMVWTAVNVANRRYQAAGAPVQANQPIVLLHKATNTPLACDPAYKIVNDFGTEYEVACHQYLKYGKTLNLINEKVGSCTGDVRQRAELSMNQWAFVTSQSPADAVDERVFVKMTPEAIVDKIRNAIKARGSHGYRGLAKTFAIIDDRGNGVLDAEEFRYALIDYGIDLRDNEFKMVLNVFDANGDGVISFQEFLQTVQGPISEFRQSVIRQAYDALDANKDGALTKADLANVYDVSQHPDFVSGRKNKGEILDMFLSHWDTVDGNGVITFSEFERYYRDMSASIEDDDYFVQMIKGAFKL
jgi:Ca2+-binding EF-hand superfamily protein